MSTSYEKTHDPTDYKGEPADVGVSVESGAYATTYEQDDSEGGLKRELKSRHIAMISIGGESLGPSHAVS
jgi:amino acid permease